MLTPLIARRRIGIAQALLMGALLAISPIFVTLSRTASGATLAALGLMLFLMAILGQNEELKFSTFLIAGAGLGLALTAGPFFLSAILSICLGLLLWRTVKSMRKDGGGFFSDSDEFLRPILWTTLIAVVVFATGLGWSLQGISRFFSSITYGLEGWRAVSPFGALTLLAIIPTYLPVLNQYTN